MSLKKAAMVNFVTKYSQVLIQLIINGILARLITPQEYGIVAIITVFISFFSIFSDMGIGAGVIQFKNLNKSDYNNIFSFTIYLGIILQIVFSLFSFVIAKIYRNEIYITLGFLLSYSILFNTINSVPQALLLKEQKFLNVGIRGIIVSFISGVITILLAFFGFKYYSIIINSILTSVLVFIWNYLGYRLRPKIIFDIHSIAIIFKYSFFQFLFSFVNFFSRNTDTLLVGYSMGDSMVGTYDKAYKLMIYPISMLSGIITPLLHPVLSNYQNNVDTIYFFYKKIFRILLYSSTLISIVCFINAEGIIKILYGSGWEEAVPCLRVLSLSIIGQMCNSISGSIFQSLGKTKLLFNFGCINTFVLLICILLGIYFGSLLSVSSMVSMGYIIVFFITTYGMTKYCFHRDNKEILQISIKNIFVFLLTLCLSYMVKLELNNIMINILFNSVICVICYVVILILLREYGEVKKLFFSLVMRNKRK